MKPLQVIEAQLTWTGEEFERDVQIEIDDDGRIARIGKLGWMAPRRLDRQALLPGMVSAHSHAFQRGLRGLGERFPAGEGSFWSWRESMYHLVETLDRESFFALTLLTFREMRAAGITTVGEFHYLHHDFGANDFAYDDLVLQAAQEAGLRLVLLNVFYRTGWIGQPLEGPQRRFATNSLEAYWKQMDVLRHRLDESTQNLGAVAHSIRAATPEDISSLYQEATRRRLVFHMHLEEQQREIEECTAAYGASPMRLLLDRLAIGANFTGVHCTHTAAPQLEEFFGRGGNVCLAPLTEANLGDGIPQAEPLRRFPAQISLGTDSNARVSMLEEMRWLEYAQRLRSESRGVFGDYVARALLRMATTGGARSLGVEAGEIRQGAWADFAAIDLDSPQLAGHDEEMLLDAIVFGGSEELVLSTCVGGQWTGHRDRAFS